MIYLDANASERLRPPARAALIAALELTGNPSSIHAAGRASRRLLEEARGRLAARLGMPEAGVIFTSGGTEAAALGVHSLAVHDCPAGRRVIRGATEHDAIRAAGPAGPVLPVGGDGLADPDALDALLATGGPALVCLMAANNETGVIHPIPALADICRRHDALLLVDAVQAAGRLPPALWRDADAIAVSAHKLGGAAGAGALLLGDRLVASGGALRPLIAGGGQEHGRRGGTPPVPLIAAFAAAAEADTPDLVPLRDAAERAAVAAGAVVLGSGSPRLPNTSCLALPGMRAEAQVIALDLAGIAVSAGAACSSGKVARSHVLDAMGAGALAGRAIRVSVPWHATAADIDAFAAAYAVIAARVRAPSRAA